MVEVPRRYWQRVALFVVAAVTAAGLACDRSPAAPGPIGVPTTLRLVGPATIAPGGGRPVTFNLMSMRGDESLNVTAAAQWGAGPFGVLGTTSFPGHIYAGSAGEGFVTATYANQTVTAEVIVIAPGTFRLDGVVRAAATGGPLRGAVVSVVAGVGKGLLAATDADGRYRLYGVAGLVSLRIFAEGFSTETVDVQVDATASRDMALAAAQPPVGIAGYWTVTIAASAACRERLPEIARVREYQALIEQESAQVRIILIGPTLATFGRSTGFYELESASLRGDLLSFAIYGDTAYDGWSSTVFTDILTDNTTIGIAAVGAGTVLGNGEIHATMSGDIEFFTRRPWSVAVCRADDHSVVFRRR